MYRALESKRPDAIFNDPYARPLAGERGEEILAGLKKARRFAWPMIVRTAVMDEVVEECVNRQGFNTVLNLAAGLDARPFRLDVPASVRWIDTDFSDILRYKQDILAGERPRCTVEFAAADLTRPDERAAVFQRADRPGARVMVITEGLLVYLTPDTVAELARDLSGRPSFQAWLTDLAAPRILAMMKRTWGTQLDRGNATLHFAPAESTAFFEPHGWKEIEFRSMFEEAFRLNRTMPLAHLWRFLGRLYPKKKQEEFRRMSGIALLARTDPEPESAEEPDQPTSPA